MLKSRAIKIAILLLISLLRTTSAISQDTSICITEHGDTLVVITPEQLKVANLIFNEHFELKVTERLLRNQIDRYKSLYEDELEIDSVYETTIDRLKLTIIDYDNINKEQAKSLTKAKTKLKYWRISSLTTAAVVLLVCLL